MEVKGIASGLLVQGIGSVCYHIPLDNGNHMDFRLDNILYIPECPARLLGLQQTGDSTENPINGCKLTRDNAILTIHGNDLTIPYDDNSYLPIVYYQAMIAASPFDLPSFDQPLAAAMSIINNGQQDNLSALQREKLKWHQHLSHASFDKINT